MVEIGKCFSFTVHMALNVRDKPILFVVVAVDCGGGEFYSEKINYTPCIYEIRQCCTIIHKAHSRLASIRFQKLIITLNEWVMQINETGEDNALWNKIQFELGPIIDWNGWLINE